MMRTAFSMRIRPQSFAFTLLLGSLGAILPLSIDMGLPALSSVSASLGTPLAMAGLTLSVFMAGFALAPIAFGPISDHYGRRPVVLFGCSLFTIAAVACAAAQTITILLLARFVQGAGAGAGLVMAFAIIRDLFEGPIARARLSYVNIVQTVAPMVAPSLGAITLSIGGWRSIYAFLAGAGLLVLLTFAVAFEESAPPGSGRLRPAQFWVNYKRVLGNRICVGYALVRALSFGCIFSYISASPLVLLGLLHVTPRLYGLLFAATSFGIMVGAFVNGRLSLRGVAASRLLTAGLLLAAVSAIGLLLLTLTGRVTTGSMMPLLLVNTFAAGIIGPNAIHGALHPVPEMAGAASAVLSFLQMVSGAASSALVAFLFDGRSAFAMAAMMTAFSLSSLAVYFSVVRRG